MDLNKFIVDEGVLGVTIGTMIGFGTTNFIKSIREALIEPFILRRLKQYSKSFNGTLGDVLASLVEFLIILLIVYMVYYFVVRPIFSDELKDQKKSAEKEEKWRSQVASTLKSIDNKFKWIS